MTQWSAPFFPRHLAALALSVATLFALFSVVSGPRADAQLGGLLRNGDSYFVAEGGGAVLFQNRGDGGFVRLGWGNDFEDSKWEIGLTAYDGLANGDTALIFDGTALFDYDFDDLTLSVGLGLDLSLSEFGNRSDFSLGVLGTAILSYRDPGNFDPYLLLRVRRSAVEVGAGFRWRF